MLNGEVVRKTVGNLPLELTESADASEVFSANEYFSHVNVNGIYIAETAASVPDNLFPDKVGAQV